MNSVNGPRAAKGRPAQRRECEGKARIGRVALMTSMLILSACGFQPLHGQEYQQSLTVGLSALSISAMGASVATNTSINSSLPRRYGELLRAEIETQINPTGLAAPKLFNMEISFSEPDEALFVKPDGTASRGDLNYTSNYTVTRLLDGKKIAHGTMARTSSYNTSSTADYASYVSIEDARKRGVMELAQDYKLRLASLLPILNNPNASAVDETPAAPVPALQPVRTNEINRSGY